MPRRFSAYYLLFFCYFLSLRPSSFAKNSFVSFTKQELTVIERMLSRGTDVTIALPYARGGDVHLLECADTRRRLIKLAARLGCAF